MSSPGSQSPERERAAGAPVLIYLQTHADVPPDDAWLDAEERSTLARLSVPKRRADWRLGRWTAKRALSTFASDGGPWAVRAEHDGAPRALLRGAAAPFVVSISHSSGRGACAVAHEGVESSVVLGCDLEVIEERSAELVDQFFTERERARVLAAGADRARLVTIIWSLKESALKALREGLRADTRSVEVEVDDLQPDVWGRAHVRVEGGRDEGGRVLHGHGLVLGDAVLTCIVDPPCDEPVVRGRG